LGSTLYFVVDSAAKDQFGLHEIFCDRIYDGYLAGCHFPDARIRYVNVGANIGGFDVKLVEFGLTIIDRIAVELNPETASRCQVNFRANAIAAKLVVAGLAGKEGSVGFFPQRNSLTDSIFSPVLPGKTCIQIRLLSLESLLLEFSPDNPEFDLLKLDCEGAEYSIISQTSPAVLESFRYIIVEFHPEPVGESVAAAYSKLAACGFSGIYRGARTGLFLDFFANTRRKKNS
jgi:FkbM family methyltransferase